MVSNERLNLLVTCHLQPVQKAALAETILDRATILFVSTRRKPPCRGECAFDLNGACMSAAKIRGSQLYGDHHC
jgi:hypothetical protein